MDNGKNHINKSGGQFGSQGLGDVELKERSTWNDEEKSSSNGLKSDVRARTPSGKSVRSKTATRAEHHDDLKDSLTQGVNRNLLFHGFIIVMGTSFIFGYNIGVLNQPCDLIRSFYNVTYAERRMHKERLVNNIIDNVTGEFSDSVIDVVTLPDSYTLTFLWSLTTTVFVIGGMIGAYSAGFVADRLGRKRATLISLLPAFLGAILSTLCIVTESPEVLMIGRFLTGIHCGAATQLAPMYLLEIAPYNLKGAFGTASQLFITIGIFIGSVLGLSNILGTVSGWPYLLLLNSVPAGLCLICLPFLPESPRYLLLVRHDKSASEKALKFLRRKKDVLADIEEMETEQSDVQKKSGDQEKYSMWKLLTAKDLRKPLIVAIFLNVIQQLSGINAIFFYSTGIYENAGVLKVYIEYAVIATNLVNVIMTIVAVPVMDKAGRRPLLLYPMMAMIVILGVITIALTTQHVLPWMSFISIACVLGYVICFAVGLGPIPMMIGAELFRQGPRPRAMSLAGLSNWFFTAVIAVSFELIQQVTKDYTFLIFFVLMIGFTLFVYFLVPETRNKTFEEIASEFQPGGVIEVDEIVDDPLYTPSAVFEDEIKTGGQDYARLKNDEPLNKLSAGKDDDDIASEEQRSLMKAEETERNIIV